MPLVVMPMSWISGMAASLATSTESSRRTNGSPPVRRILLIPNVHRHADEAFDFLERQRSCERCMNCTFSAGMQ